MSLLFLTAPAKTMDESPGWKSEVYDQPALLSQAAQVASALREMNEATLKAALGASDRITRQNYMRYQQWQMDHTLTTAKPALLMYRGDIYKQMAVDTYSAVEQRYAHESIRILSGLYGMLRGYDLIQPYRLEMRTKLPLREGPEQIQLDRYWKAAVTQLLVDEVESTDRKAIVNLASKEYSAAVDLKKLPVPVVEVDFVVEDAAGKRRTVAIYAKQARGALMDYAVRNRVIQVQELAEFEGLGFACDQVKSNRLVFVRRI